MKVEKLINVNTAHFIESRNKICSYQKISTMMSTELWIPREDHLKDIHEKYLKYKKMTEVKHWLNEQRMVYNASQKLDIDVSLYDSVFIKLYFKTYPMEYTDLIILYNWFFDILQHIYRKEKSSSTFSTDLFFKEMFRVDLNNCSKHVYLSNEKNLVTVNMVRGIEMSFYSFRSMFESHIIYNKSFCLLSLMQYYLCLKDYYRLNLGLNLGTKPKHGQDFYTTSTRWLRKMLNVIETECKGNVSHVYDLFVPYLNDYFVTIPNDTSLKQFHVQYNSLEETIAYNSLLEMENPSVIDLLVHSKPIQLHTEYLETLNMYLFILKYQTSSNLFEEMKCLYYQFTRLEKLKSISDAMLRNILENYNSTKRKYNNTVFQEWLLQKMAIILQNDINLLDVFRSSINMSDQKCNYILERCFRNNLPTIDMKELVDSIMDAHCENHNYLIRLLNFFLCFIEYKNIAVESVPIKDPR